MSIYDPGLYCPVCQQSAPYWRYGLVYHHEWVHVRLRNQPPGCKVVQDLAWIGKRTMTNDKLQMSKDVADVS